MDTDLLMMMDYDLGIRSRYTSTLPHTWRVSSVDIEGSQESLVMISGKRFGEQVCKVIS
jgi:hypothetical protein